MSFVRVGRTQQHSKAKRPARPKKAAASRREWVSTVNDLTVHKLTPAELSHRHEIHKSHNKVAAQWELRERSLKRRLRHGGSPAPLDEASLSIIREVFSDQLLLQDVLARSDKAMAVVKDLFGDAPRRQTGHPSVTMAPNCDSDSEMPVLQRPDPPTQLSLLSQSMMDKQALNEVEASEQHHRDKGPYPCGSSVQQVIRRSNVQKMKARSQGRAALHRMDHPSNYNQADGDDVPVTPCTSGRAPDQAALNATVAVQRVQSRQRQLEEENEPSVLVSQVLNPDVPLNQPEKTSSQTSKTRKRVSRGSELDNSAFTSLNGSHSSLGLLQDMLGQVEDELNTLRPDTATGSAHSPKQHRTQSLTGFSVALVSTLGRLVHLFKQREEEVKKESQERRRLEEQLREQRGLIDALTAESMTLREEAATLQAALQWQTAGLERKLDTILLSMGGLGLLEPHTDLPQGSDIKTAVCQPAPVPERLPQRTQVAGSPAVMLSPPRQRGHSQHIPMAHPVPLHQQLSPVNIQCQDLGAYSSASSLTSLPLVSLPSTSSDSLSSQIAPEAMMAEIAQLSRQNDLLRAQLSQIKDLGSEVGGSPNSSTEQRRLSPCSSGRITPHGIDERRPSGSNSRGRQSKNNQAADGVRLAHQATFPNDLNVNGVEQRLLELNRQSAAARGRLLELIEQQKESVSSKASPSVSPISHRSTISPQTAVAGRSSEVSVLPPAQELLSQAGGDEKRAFHGSETSFFSFGGETRDDRTQVAQQRGREGWFALSAHVR